MGQIVGGVVEAGTAFEVEQRPVVVVVVVVGIGREKVEDTFPASTDPIVPSCVVVVSCS